jgi:transaldolase
MEIFLDTIDVESIRLYHDYGIISGVTTNPSLMKSAKKDFWEVVREICSVNAELKISIEVPSSDYHSMIQEGNKLIDFAENIVIKLPMTWDGIKACKYFVEKKRSVNMTLCFSLLQAMMAAK